MCLPLEGSWGGSLEFITHLLCVNCLLPTFVTSDEVTMLCGLFHISHIGKLTQTKGGSLASKSLTGPSMPGNKKHVLFPTL